jgi:hypothetical protein
MAAHTADVTKIEVDAKVADILIKKNCSAEYRSATSSDNRSNLLQILNLEATSDV